jgi:uncharacterized peroxidase-related enzyme
MSRIEVIEYENAQGDLQVVYDEIIDKRGALSEVLKIQSLHPASLKSHMQLYLDIMFAQSPLSRQQRELIAVVVSVANQCEYCTVHHTAALNNYWKDDSRIQMLTKDYKQAGLPGAEIAMCDFAVHLTTSPGDHGRADFTATLKQHSFTDRAILDITLVTAYFNFVNRMVLSLGVLLESQQGEGFKY